MPAFVYVHAAYHEHSQEILGTLIGFYYQIMNVRIDGLERVETLARYDTLEDRPAEFRDAIRKCFQDADSQRLKSIGLLTRWENLNYAHDFQKGPIHKKFSEYANGTLGRAWYRIIQYQDGKMATLEVKR